MAETTNNPLTQSFVAQQLGTDRYKQMLQAQQQQQLANALLQQGTTPIDTNNRQIGGVGYRVSPMEGVAKLAQALTGAYGETQANSKLADALMPQGGAGGQGTGIGAGLPPNLQGLAMAYPEVALKSQLDNYYADHRAGSTYRSPDGTIHTAPTDAQLNSSDGSPAPATPPPTSSGAPPPTLPPQPPIVPVQGGQPLPPVGVPQANGPLPPPPPAPALANPQVPTGTPAPLASAATDEAQGAMPIPQDIPAMPTRLAGDSTTAYLARIEAAKAGMAEQAKVVPAGQTKAAETSGENLADNIQEYNGALAGLSGVQQSIKRLHDANNASSFNVLNSAEGTGPVTLYHNARQDQTSVNNSQLQQVNKQGLISQMGSQLAGSNIKGNKLVEGTITKADSLDLSSGKPAVDGQINGLYRNYLKNLVAGNQKVALSGGKPTPLPSILMNTPKGQGMVDMNHVEDAINNGATFVFQ